MKLLLTVTVVVSLLGSVPADVWAGLEGQPSPVRAAAFGLVIIHALLMTRQLLGVRGETCKKTYVDVSNLYF